jgi:uncharacterized protein YdhG (YjbR/CyaY superfamily)
MTAKQPLTGQGIAAVEAYLASIPEPAHSALEHLRATIRSAAPDAEEAMVYGAPGFRLNGRALVCYAAHRSHCGFYPMSPALMDTLAAELAGFRTAKGTIHFTPDQRLPDALVRKIVKARVKEDGTGKGA